MARAFLAALAASFCPASSPGAAGLASVSTQAAAVTLSVGKSSYAPGETIIATVVVTNRSDSSVTLTFGTTQRYDFALIDGSGRGIWRWSMDRAFGQAIGEETLEPGGRLSYTERLRAPAAPGGYRLVGTIVVMGAPLTASAPITVGR